MLTLMGTTLAKRRESVDSDYVYETLRNRILNGNYSVREKLIEERIASELNSTRSRVRVAFLRLVDEGLLVSEPHRGVRIKEISLKEAIEILEIRKLLEIHAAKQACRNISATELQRLSIILDSMGNAVSNGDFELYSKLNTSFHEIIYGAADQMTLTNVLVSLKTKLMRYQYKIAFIPGRAANSLEEHRNIFQAISERDEERAGEFVAQHIEHLKESIIQNRQLLEISEGLK
ncbi:MAG: GntR family transcriptional regulator [Thermoplasmataceae archaeon]